MRHFAVTLFLLGVLFIAVAGCRKQSSTEPTGGAVATAASQPAGENHVVLKILQWGENVGLKEPFEKYALAHGLKLTVVMAEPFVAEHNDIFDGIRSERGDVAIAPIEILRVDNAKLVRVLLPIDVTRIRNYDAIASGIRKSPLIKEAHTIDGKLYGVPFEGDVQTLLYNTNRLATPPDSYAELWDDAHKNRIATMGWLGRYNVAMTVLALGYKPEAYYSRDADNILWDQVGSKVVQLVANSRIIYGNIFGTPPWDFNADELSQCDIVFGWGSMPRLLNKKAGAWRIALPKEGSEFWLDDIVIGSHLKDQPEKLAAAYLWIEFLLESQTQIDRYKQEPPVIAPINAQAMGVLKEQGYDDPRLDENFFASDRLFLARQTDQRTRNYYQLVWSEALKKAGKIRERDYLEKAQPETAPTK